MSIPKNVENIDDLLKRKSEEISNLRAQLIKKDDKNNHLKSLQISFDTLKDRLNQKEKMLAECKGLLGEKDVINGNLEIEIDLLKKEKYLNSLKEKNNNSKNDNAKSSAQIKIVSFF